MDILRLNSKIKLDCNRCDKCCIYRGDIKLTPVNVSEISQYLKISKTEFIDNYTDRLKGRPLEIVLKTRGEMKECIFYDSTIHGCSIHTVKPMQCTMFPLVPENLKRDYFYDSEQCKIDGAREITVNEWLNGNNNNYKRNKESCLEWIRFLEYIQPRLINASLEKIEEYYKILFENYDYRKGNLRSQMKKNINKIIKDFTS